MAPAVDVVTRCRNQASARLVVVIALLTTAVVALAAAVAVLTTVSEFSLTQISSDSTKLSKRLLNFNFPSP